MKTSIHFQLVLLLLFIPFFVFSQQQKPTVAVKYGDNAKAGKYLNTRGIKLYYETYGKGQPLLLIHGNGGSLENFKYQIPYFEKYYRVIAVDSRAQGKSIDSSDSLSYEMMTDDFNALLDSLHIDSAYVIGWSDGGINGLLLAIRHPEKVKKLAETGANLIPDTSVFNPGTNAYIAENAAKFKSQKQDENARNAYKLFHMMQVAPNIPASELNKIQCAVLVIGGDHDAIKPAHTLEIFEDLPHAYLWIVPESGHATLQRNKDEFNNKVHDFFTHPYHTIKWNDWDE